MYKAKQQKLSQSTNHGNPRATFTVVKTALAWVCWKALDLLLYIEWIPERIFMSDSSYFVITICKSIFNTVS